MHKMNSLNNTLINSIAATAFGLMSLTAQAESPSAMPTANTSRSSMQQDSGEPHDMKKLMSKGMDSMQTMQMSGDMDKDFAMMMKMHHQQALDMAQMEIAHGKSPEMKAMAKKMVAAQKKEIAQFDKWLAKHE